jgi:hypothetical protein
VLATAWLVTTAAPAAAQAATPPVQGGFPDASFGVTFLKFIPPANVYSPFYSWDAHMALDLTVARNGPNVVAFAAEFQTVGTENLGTKVSVGGTGYIIRAAYTRVWSPDLALSVGVSHLSSHLTRDLDAKTAEARARGLPIPQVQDPSEYNVLFFRGSHRFSTWPHAPVIDVAVEPLNFRFNGSRAALVRPIYIATNLMLWKGHEKALVAETHHEFGTRPWNQVSLFLELYARHQAEGRFQIFVTASPGHSLHVSPNVGALRDGIAAGVRLTFRS